MCPSCTEKGRVHAGRLRGGALLGSRAGTQGWGCAKRKKDGQDPGRRLLSSGQPPKPFSMARLAKPVSSRANTVAG